PCVFKGYLQDDLLNQKVLINIPEIDPTQKLLKTGDTAKLNTHGQILYVNKSSSAVVDHNNNQRPSRNIQLEHDVHQLWCKLLNQDEITFDKNFYSLGGNSILFMKLFNSYQTLFVPHKQLNITDFSQYLTINEHVAKLNNETNLLPLREQWLPLNIHQGIV
ncbi:unnamed protein product, partial [Didymodactylos carnosus]